MVRTELYGVNREAISCRGFAEALLAGLFHLAVTEYVAPVLGRELQVEVRFAEAVR
jgi:hypothetical protein